MKGNLSDELLATSGPSLDSKLTTLSGKYANLFRDYAPTMFSPVLDGADKSTQRQFTALKLDDAVNADTVRGYFRDAAQKNAQLISTLPTDHIERIRKAVAESPGDLSALKDILSDANGKLDRRSRNIALDQTRKAFIDTALAKAKSTGARRGIWIHSHRGPKHSRPKHVAVHGDEFDLEEGLPVGDEGQNVVPGEERHCHCTFKLVVDFGVK
ncbi:hypothetical protein [Citrobacter gillenii]|uniref:hypothetical protein n=1 Tax=Citrobacter gillenii TaxID=67828 RepID=UPI0039866299